MFNSRPTDPVAGGVYRRLATCVLASATAWVKIVSYVVRQPSTSLRSGSRQLIERNQSELRKWLAWAQEPSEQATLAHIERARAAEAEHRCLFRAIVVGGRIVGDVGLASIDWENRCASIGYWIDHGHQGRGVVTAGVAVLARHAFDDLKLQRTEIRTDVLNTRSRAVAERLGFRYEGTLRQAYKIADGRYSDDAVYAMLASDPERLSLPSVKAV
jgi:ribosomal-protein-serine acetyltransferase